MKLSININFEGYLADYLANFFEKKKDKYYMNLSNDVGLMLNSLLEKSSNHLINQGDISIVISSTKSKINYWARNVITIEDQKRFEDFMRVKFNLDFHYWMLIADQLGIEKKRAYEMFLSARGIRVMNKNMEALKKKDYRFRQKIKKRLTEQIEVIDI